MTLRALAMVPAIALLTLPGNLKAQEASPADRAAVLAAVDSLFSSMSRRDTLASRAILLPGAVFYIASGGRARSSSDTAYIRSLSRDAAALKERIWSPTVLIHGSIAQVWTPYDFHVDGKFSHCGVDSFSLVRTEAGWRIAAATYTIETTGCPESPLGPYSAP